MLFRKSKTTILIIKVRFMCLPGDELTPEFFVQFENSKYVRFESEHLLVIEGVQNSPKEWNFSFQRQPPAKLYAPPMLIHLDETQHPTILAMKIYGYLQKHKSTDDTDEETDAIILDETSSNDLKVVNEVNTTHEDTDIVLSRLRTGDGNSFESTNIEGIPF